MEHVTTRPASMNDLAVLLSFEQEIVKTERPFHANIKDGEVHYYDLAQMITAPHINVIVAVVNDEIIGSGYARIEDSKIYLKHPKQSYLGFMYVKPEHRGKGVNKMIIEALTAWSRQQGITELRLDVYNDNIPAIKAYEKTGFKKLMIQMRKGIE